MHAAVYHVEIRSDSQVVAETVTESLGDAIQWADRVSQPEEYIAVYEALEEVSGGVIHIDKVMEWIDDGYRQGRITGEDHRRDREEEG